MAAGGPDGLGTGCHATALASGLRNPTHRAAGPRTSPGWAPGTASGRPVEARPGPMTKILEVLNRTGARSFPDACACLAAAPYHLRIAEHGPLYTLRYDKGQSDFRNQVVRQARGIILEKDTNRIVSWAFDKFFEYGEDAPTYRDRPNLRKSVSDPLTRFERKYDGSLIKVVRYPGADDGLLVSTNGRIDASHAPLLSSVGGCGRHSVTDGDLGSEASEAPASAKRGRSFRDLFAEAGGLDLPYEDGVCYMFELLSPEISTVAPAWEPALVHLASRALSGDFRELPAEQRFDLGATRLPEVVPLRNFGACREAARLLPWDDEGFVVLDASGIRTKVKSEAYKSMQRLLIGDSEDEDHDALTVALTLHRASAGLPDSPAPLVLAWQRRLEDFAVGCLARLPRALASSARAGLPAQRSRAAMQAALIVCHVMLYHIMLDVYGQYI